MKKILVSLMVLALCVPAMAATVVVTDNADGTGVITVTTESDNIVGLGLDILVTGGAQITALTLDDDANPATDNLFNIYPDAAQVEVTGDGYTYGEGSPIAVIGAAGVATLPSSSFAISAGMLNGAAVPGAAGAATVTINVSTDLAAGTSCTVAVTENAIRGGIVLTTGAGEDITSQTGDTITNPLTECFSSAAGQKYTDWLAYGSPDCWCFQRQCNGDATGTREGTALSGYKWVFNGDLAIFLQAYNVAEPTKGPGIMSIPNGICADFTHTREGTALSGYKRVFNGDLAIFLANYNQAEPTKGPGVAICPLTTAGGDIVFYTN